MGTIDINTVLDTNLAFNGGPTKTHAMVCGGLAIDNGKNFSGLTTDQRGPGFARTMPPSLRWAFVTGAYSRMSFAS
jgi:hypothetical protein